MPITQISKIQHRSGDLADLPQLSVGEFGWATDEKRLFIGNDATDPTVLPDNTEILTVFSKTPASGANTEVQFNSDGRLGAVSSVTGPVASGQFTYNYQGNLTTGTGGNGLLTVNNLRVTEGANIDHLVVSGNASVLGNLSVTGNVFFNDVSTLVVSDPVIYLGAGANGTALINNDLRDRGTIFQYYTTSEKSAFFGYQNSSGNFILGNSVSYDGVVVTVIDYGNLILGNLVASGNITGSNLILTGGSFSTTGNVSGNNLSIANNATIGGNLSTTGDVSGSTIIASVGFNGNLTSNSITTGASTTPGTITGNWTLSAGSRFEATYADIGERYSSDNDYPSGTVMMIGGSKEVTMANCHGKYKLAGIVSSEPAYILNSNLEGSVIIALTGRVPCMVVGTIDKGDMLTISNIDGVATSTNEPIGVIARALEKYDSLEVGIIDVKVDRA